MLGRVAVNIIF